MTVLLVEDDAMVRLTLAEFFEAAGIDFLDAENAAEALIILENPSQRIEVLVTDLDLGPGDDGLALALKARRCRPGLRVIYETGSPEMFRGHVFSEWERVFTKPFDPVALSTAVAGLQDARRRRGRAAVKAAASAP